jgi:hypothetical protein
MVTAPGGARPTPGAERLVPAHPFPTTTLRLWLPISALAAICVALCALTWLGSYDDAYITYTFARNLAAGQGWSWGGVRILGTSSPLFAALLAVLEHIAPVSIPVWGHLVTWSAALGAATGIFLIGRREGWPWAAFALGLAWLLAPAMLGVEGSEYLPGIACVVAGALALGCGRAGWAGLSLGAAVALRPELALAAALVAGAHVARHRSRTAWRDVARSAAIALTMFGLWAVAVRVTAGVWIPTTLAAKRAQAASSIWAGGRHLPPAALAYGKALFPRGMAVLLVLAAIGGARSVAQWRRWPFAAVTVLWGVLHLAMLMALGVPFYHWYLLPTFLGVLCGLAVWLEPPLRAPSARRIWRAGAVALLVSTFGLNAMARLTAVVRTPREGRETAYREAAAWINAHYPPATTVGALEVGYLGYYGLFRTVDFLGLVNPAVPLDAIAARDWHRVWVSNQPDLLMVSPNVEWLVRQLVGDAAGFARTYHLEYLQVDTTPPVILFRRAGLAARGEFRVDLLQPSAPGHEVSLELRNGLTLPALALAPKAALEWHLRCSSGCRFACGAASRDAAIGAVYAHLDGNEGAAGEASAGATWTLLAVPAREGLHTLRLTCAAPGAGCLVAVPYLRGGTLALAP